MNELEKSLYMEYGSQRIPKERVREVLMRAASNRLIEEKDVTEQPAMYVNELLEHVSFLRRQFLYQDELLHHRQDSGEGKACMDRNPERDPRMFNRVLRAYLEYEKIHYPRMGTGIGVLKTTAILLATVMATYFLYTPKPY